MNEVVTKPSIRARVFRRAHHAVGHVAGLTLLAGAIIQLTVVDSWRSTATLFYLLPLNVIALGGGFLSIYWFQQGRRRWALLHVVAAAGSFTLFCDESWAPRPEARGESPAVTGADGFRALQLADRISSAIRAHAW